MIRSIEIWLTSREDLAFEFPSRRLEEWPPHKPLRTHTWCLSPASPLARFRTAGGAPAPAALAVFGQLSLKGGLVLHQLAPCYISGANRAWSPVVLPLWKDHLMWVPRGTVISDWYGCVEWTKHAQTCSPSFLAWSSKGSAREMILHYYLISLRFRPPHWR